MAELLKGALVARSITEKCAERAEKLQNRGVVPTLAIVRVGENDSDLSYERGAEKRCREAGIAVRGIHFAADVDNETYLSAIRELNEDNGVHGILLLMPLPPQLDEKAARKALIPGKDVDGCTAGSLAGVFMNSGEGFPPCTAQAAMELLDYYGVECRGKQAAVAGRSLVFGRPAAMLLMHRNATVTVCHSRTEEMDNVLRQADIVLVGIGKMESIGKEYFRPGQTVIDIGIHWNAEKQKLCGDVKFDEAETVVAAITPVPGGVGAVTTSVLAKHVIDAAERLSGESLSGRD